MAKKLLNGYTAWVGLGITLLVLYTGTVVWGVRLEGKTGVNSAEIRHIDKYMQQINEKLDILLEKL